VSSSATLAPSLRTNLRPHPVSLCVLVYIFYLPLLALRPFPFPAAPRRRTYLQRRKRGVSRGPLCGRLRWWLSRRPPPPKALPAMHIEAAPLSPDASRSLPTSCAILCLSSAHPLPELPCPLPSVPAWTGCTFHQLESRGACACLRCLPSRPLSAFQPTFYDA
jgi:hypothetical protein